MIIVNTPYNYLSTGYEPSSNPEPLLSTDGNKTEVHFTLPPRYTEFDDTSDFTDDSFLDTLDQTPPIIYGIAGGASLLGFMLIIYACYKFCIHKSRWQQARTLATISLPPQFPIGAPHIYKDDLLMTLVNE